MSASIQFLDVARSFAYRRGRKCRKSSRRKENPSSFQGERKGPWVLLGTGLYSEVWAHDAFPDKVLKISGPDSWVAGRANATSMNDPWQWYARYAMRFNGEGMLPQIDHFENITARIVFATMPRLCCAGVEYATPEYAVLRDRTDELRGNRSAYSAPAWWREVVYAVLDPHSGMREDLHSDNVMRDPDTGRLVITDPVAACEVRSTSAASS